MKRTRLLRYGAAALALFASLWASPLTVQAADPDFSQIEDILLGQRDLLPAHDLVVSFNDATRSDQGLMKTTNGTAPTHTTLYHAQGLGSARAPVERMYNRPRDVVVVVAPITAWIPRSMSSISRTSAAVIA